MPITNGTSPKSATVVDVANQGRMAAGGPKWIASVRARGDMLMGYRRDTPDERRRLADELRAKMMERGVVGDVRDNEIEFIIEDETPLLRARIREKLISAFKDRQAIDRQYLPLDDVVKAWAPLRRESPLTAAKECARADLIEAALDGHIPELLYLPPQAPLESVIDPDGRLLDPISPDGRAAYLTAVSLDQALTMGPLPRTIEMALYCWAGREAVISFLRKRGVDSLGMPTAWFKDSPGDDTNAVPGLDEMTTGKQPRVLEYLLSKFPGCRVPDPAFVPRKGLRQDILDWDSKTKRLLNGKLDDDTLKKAINAHNKNASNTTNLIRNDPNRIGSE